ncbi:hypothetical protein [Dyella flagellata]|uniref:Uncharacterized protein n=1 Tax=Dyella flagellata TaxID=1867833 RepID=A0ABQ5X8Z1_9GAMM|nr:hypothetical protein [Dyella flagellata]GLQ87747.1 hypothetical protein GCM10007898_13150 [Dyella flagellata]
MSDDRPVAITQQRLQQAADDSPQVRQLQALQLMADESALQMKAISTTVLNVAGEDHFESDARRNEEKKVTSTATNGGYWTEEQFKLTINDKKVDADPKALRFLSHLQVLSGPWSSLAKAPLAPEFFLTHAKKTWDDYGRLNKKIEDNFIDSLGDRYSGGDALSEEKGLERDRINWGLYAQFDTAKRALQGIIGLHPYNDTKKVALNRLREQFRTAVPAMVEKVPEKEELHSLRSGAMHCAAEAKSNYAGVWKIGQQHVDEISEAPLETPLAYNLMTRKEFNEEYARLSEQQAQSSESPAA